MHKRHFLLTVALATTILNFIMGFTAGAVEVPRMSADELKSQLGSDQVVILEVPTSADWDRSKMKVAGAGRVAPGNVALWANNYDKEKMIVLYCA